MAGRARWTAIAIVVALVVSVGAYWGVSAALHNRSGGTGTPNPSPASSGPAASTVLLPVVACPSTYGTTGVPSANYPAAENIELPTKMIGALALYSDKGRAIQPITGPAGWGCSVHVAVDGGLVVNVFPPGESGTGPMVVSAYGEPACTGCMYDAVCPLIPYAEKIFGYPFPCQSGRSPGEAVKWLAGPKAYATHGFDVVGFTDPPGIHGDGTASGGRYPAHGVLLFTWSSTGSLGVAEISCTVAPSYEPDCPEILALFQQERWNGYR